MFEKEQLLLEQQVNSFFENHNLKGSVLNWTWIPFSGHWGLSTSLFKIVSLNKNYKEELSVKEKAQHLAIEVVNSIILPAGFEMVEPINGYLNFYFDSNEYACRVIDRILSLSEKYGKGASTTKTIMVEYSQPNTHKAFHVGHLRNMVLGSSICRILEFAGNTIIRANYIGDIGLHVIKWLWNYINFHQGEIPPKDNKTKWMGGLYSEAIKRLETDPNLDSEVRELFLRWDKRDPEIVSLWKKTRDWSLDAFKEVYSLLDIQFDRIYYESEVEEAGKIIVDELIDKELAIDERPEGAVIVDLDKLLGTKEKYRVLVVLRSDGTSLYPSKDLPLAIMKFSEFDLDQSIYVIDVRQSLYMKQIFKLLELLDYKWAENCYHLAYEIVNLPGNVTIASREGTVVLLEDLISEAEKRAAKIVELKNPDVSEKIKADISQKIALGAIKYSLLSRDNTKIITFDWDAAMDVNGQAAPYIQYAFVRANSILRKVNGTIPETVNITWNLSSAEIQLVDQLSRFPQEVQRSSKDLRPILIANYSYELAKTFSNFYNKCPVLSEEGDLRYFRLRLVAAFRQVIEISLGLLGIDAPQIM
jgi:arginyl-tRNA synthetase